MISTRLAQVLFGLIVVSSAAFVAVPANADEILPSAAPHILVSETSDLSDAVDLDGAMVSDQAVITVMSQSQDYSSVAFFLDDVTQSGKALDGASGNTLDFKADGLAPGRHSLVAVATADDSTKLSTVACFNVTHNDGQDIPGVPSKACDGLDKVATKDGVATPGGPNAAGTNAKAGATAKKSDSLPATTAAAKSPKKITTQYVILVTLATLTLVAVLFYCIKYLRDRSYVTAR